MIRNEQELRDPTRLKTLWWSRQWGNLLVAVLAWTTVAAMVAGLFLLEHLKFSSKDPGPFGNIGYFLFFFCGALIYAGLAGWFGLNMWREVFNDALFRYQREPERFRFGLGKIERADFIPYGGKRSLNKYLLLGEFSSEGRAIPIIEIVSARLWKKLKWRLPRPVWVVFDVSDPAVSCLAGVPVVDPS